MHDGSFTRLEQVIDFYDEGGIPNANLDVQIRPIGLTEPEEEALLAFLQALTGASARP
jgi:cytochrome c peroxidase